jgi:crotonobetainyl-CoA:carnitine CoA-transferase CaiB-like acyl-CoA transferase
MNDKGTGPLTGMRVVELAHIMAGPVCGLMLADMGADVIKVEKLPGGDDSRRFLPPAIEGQSAAFMMVNRNKRGIALNLKTERGKAVLHHLLESTDVLVENYRTGTMEQLGFGYSSLREIHPRLIYCSVSGYGRTGPYSRQAGFDLVAQGMTGLMSITGEGPGRAPIKCGAPLTDITAGILAACGIVAAYAERLRSGQGQAVDTSLFEAGIVQTYWQSAICLATGQAPGPMGSSHPLSAPYQAFQTADGWITIGAANQHNWQRLLDVLNAREIGSDARFVDNAARMNHLPELQQTLTPYFVERSSGDWLARLEAAGIPSGPVLSIADMLCHEQTLAREMVVPVQHSSLGTVNTLGLPLKFSRTPGEVKNGAPIFGQHTREILSDIGYEVNEIDQLIADGTVFNAG